MQEIERKFRVRSLPFDVEKYPHYTIEQGYICTDPVLRVRMSGELEDKGQVLREAHCTLCYKSSGLMSHREESFPINVDQFQRLKEKAEGKVIEKVRYRIPFDSYVIELDLFKNVKDPMEPTMDLMMAEVEFPSEDEAMAFTAPEWFGEEVTLDKRYHNSEMTKSK